MTIFVHISRQKNNDVNGEDKMILWCLVHASIWVRSGKYLNWREASIINQHWKSTSIWYIQNRNVSIDDVCTGSLIVKLRERESVAFEAMT